MSLGRIETNPYGIFSRSSIKRGGQKALLLFSNPLWWVFILTVIGGILRRYHLAAKSLWLDEAMLFDISQGNLSEIINKNANMSSAPPLYPLLLRSIQVFGDTELVLRGFSMIFGILSIPLAYFLFGKFMNAWAAVVSTLLVAIAPSQIIHSQLVREYSLTFALSLGMILTTWNYIHSPRRRSLGILILVWTIGIWIQYGLSVLAVSLNVIFLLHWARNRNFPTLYRWILGQIPILVSVVLIYIIALRSQYVSGGSGIQYLAAGYWSPSEMNFATFGLKQTADLLQFTFPDTYVFLSVLTIGIIASLSHPLKRIQLVWVFIPLGFALLFGLLRMYPYLGSRHNMYLTPIIFLLCGLGFESMFKIKTGRIIGPILLIVMSIHAFQVDLNYYKQTGVENIRPILTQLNAQIRPGDRIYVYYGAESAFRYYTRNEKLNWVAGKWHRNKPENYYLEIDPFIQESGRLWLVFSHCYRDECDKLRDYVSKIRPVELVGQDAQVWLYLAP